LGCRRHWTVRCGGRVSTSCSTGQTAGCDRRRRRHGVAGRNLQRYEHCGICRLGNSCTDADGYALAVFDTHSRTVEISCGNRTPASWISGARDEASSASSAAATAATAATAARD
jgi:hypothetical protein